MNKYLAEDSEYPPKTIIDLVLLSKTEECPIKRYFVSFPLFHFTLVHPVFALLKSYLYIDEVKLSFTVRPENVR